MTVGLMEAAYPIVWAASAFQEIAYALAGGTHGHDLHWPVAFTVHGTLRFDPLRFGPLHFGPFRFESFRFEPFRLEPFCLDPFRKTVPFDRVKGPSHTHGSRLVEMSTSNRVGWGCAKDF